MSGSSTRRFDPERKQRIIEACLDVIAERGVAGTSHRAVAAEAHVPLGSMTYHFDGIDDLLHQAFERFADRSAATLARRMAHAANADEACEQVALHIEHDLFGTRRSLIIGLELYTLAARNPAFRDITDRWMAASRLELERFFPPDAAMLIDAMIEGLMLHRALGKESRSLQDPAIIRAGIRRIVTADQ
ncbi:TetR/AcrR family transcriptional regulator [Bifidobacterium simiarum]|uniref:TetR family transcriptional regulator n=1 Tax=Bifidobacterium simiarum TaxID=2045441 RepID=A0A2M9HD36_9BIFI|nr:TetR family transcriptional regulator [Bifidobacterium simiarum]PJM74712.1 TetR family transcriptional regulator [Bifidobacterium simiarum]